MSKRSTTLLGLSIQVIVAIALIALIAFAVRGRQSNAGSSGGFGGQFRGGQPTVPTVQVAQLTRQDLTPTASGFGTLAAGRTAELRPLLTGLLIEASPALTAGNLVSAGHVLARVDPAAYQEALTLAALDRRASLNQIDTLEQDVRAQARTLEQEEARFALAQASYERAQDLAAQNLLSDTEISNAEGAYLNAASARDAAQLQSRRLLESRADLEIAAERALLALQRAERDLALTDLTAPFDALITSAAYALGSQVSSGSVLASFADLSDLTFAFQLDAESLGALLGTGGGVDALLGTPMEITWQPGDGATFTYPAIISRLSPNVAQGQSAATLFATLSLDPGQVVPPLGSLLAFSLDLPAIEQAFVVPNTALSADDELYLVDQESQLQSLAVNAVRTVGEQVVIEGAIPEGATYVTRQFAQLSPGINVQIPAGEGEEAARDDAATPPTNERPQGGGGDSRELTSAQAQCLLEKIRARDDLPPPMVERVVPSLEQNRISERFLGAAENRFGLDVAGCLTL